MGRLAKRNVDLGVLGSELRLRAGVGVEDLWSRLSP